MLLLASGSLGVIFLLLLCVVIFSAIGIQLDKNKRPVGYCESDSNCAEGCKCVDSKCAPVNTVTETTDPTAENMTLTELTDRVAYEKVILEQLIAADGDESVINEQREVVNLYSKRLTAITPDAPGLIDDVPVEDLTETEETQENETFEAGDEVVLLDIPVEAEYVQGRWSADEVATLEASIEAGDIVEDIALKLNREVASVKRKIKALSKVAVTA